jgi:hypothetical protein
MSATRKLRKLFTPLRSDGVSRRTSGLSGVGPPRELRMIQVLVSLMYQEFGHRSRSIFPGPSRGRSAWRRSLRVQSQRRAHSCGASRCR